MAEERKRRKNKEVAGEIQDPLTHGAEQSEDSHAHDPEALMRLLVSSVSDYAIFLLDTQGRVASWNKGAQKIKGYRADEIIGQHFSKFYPPEDIARNHPQQELEIAMRVGRYEEEGWRVRKDGTRFLADVVITALYDEKGEHRGFAKVTRDITERKKAEAERAGRHQAEEQLHLLVENIIDYAIFLLDSQGRVMTWNRGAERIKGYRANEIIGRHFSVFYTTEDLAHNHPTEVLAAALRDGHYEEESWRLRKDGTRFLADVVITALYDENGEHRGYAKITRDITNRVRAEEDRLHRAQERVSRAFLRDILFSVTEGRLRFCDSSGDLPEKLHPFGNPIDVSKESLCAIRSLVLKAARICTFPQDRSQDLLTGVSEAAMNAEVHANGARCEIFTAGAGKLATIQAWICDTGTGIDLTQVHRATLERGFTTQGGMGHGFWLMLNTCDRIWLLTGSEGTTVVLEQDGQLAEPEWMGSRSYTGTQTRS